MAIREDTKGRILLTGLHQVDINSVEDLLGALNFGSSIRQTDATAINAKSSRSHAVFSLNLLSRTKKPQTTKQEKRFSVPIEAMSGSDSYVTVDSKLHFVDLAGSERLKNTQAQGERAREGISINAGLASLGKVISQLSQRQMGSHVSYRDSKLTRLLQDSLGGNAITYVIACVTPAEFHLSETLNTVQYAERARAIQSKPQIQQVDEGDKKAVIERLKAEITFLRDQINKSESGDRRSGVLSEKLERQSEKEAELQNHLLDMQENYTALSQRHTKLISEITKAHDDESSENPMISEMVGDSAVARLKRSSSLKHTVEQVVVEYEKTVESLESSLSKTRSTLSGTESKLLERETKCAYMESQNQHLHNRLIKMQEREANTDNYLHELESKLDSHSSGEDKSSAIISELRKEVNRVRENEGNREEYIETLEERLADYDQDKELMQRELDRLEHVVERQRSVGKLDNLLHEFDLVNQNGKAQSPEEMHKPLTNGVSKHSTKHRQMGAQTPDDVFEDATSDNRSLSDDDDEHPPVPPKDSPRLAPLTPETPKFNGIRSRPGTANGAFSQSPSQLRFVNDKLDNVTQELLDLQMKHDATLNDLDMMAAKYEEALRAMAQMQDTVDEARHPPPLQVPYSPGSTRPASYLGDARNSGQPTSAKTLSSELSLTGDTVTSGDQDGTRSPTKDIDGDIPARTTAQQADALSQLEELKREQSSKDQAITLLKDGLSSLEDQIENLKTENAQLKMKTPTSPIKPLIRRKGSQQIMTMDRAHRSLAALRNIAAESLEDKPDTMQNFEQNISTCMLELHQRTERVQALEVELSKLKKEMETKASMISGLTRERTSLKSSGQIDYSVVSSIHGQLVQNENQLKSLQESHAMREKELVNEVDALKKSLSEQAQASKAMPGFFPETPAPSLNDTDRQLGNQDNSEVLRLRSELSQWQSKHQEAVESLQSSEKNFAKTITELEKSMMSFGAGGSPQGAEGLQQELFEHKSIIRNHEAKVAELQRSQAAAQEMLEENQQYRLKVEDQLSVQRQMVSELESSCEEHKSAVEFHKHGLKSLHDAHDRYQHEKDTEIQENVRKLEQAKADYDNLQRVKNDQLMESIEMREQIEVDKRGVEDELHQVTRDLETKLAELAKANDRARELNVAFTEMTSTMEEYKQTNDKQKEELAKVSAERDKATRLVDELEDQLSATYDQHRATNSRLSVLSNNHDHALQEAYATRAKLEAELEHYRGKVAQAEVCPSHLPLPVPPSILPNTDIIPLQAQLQGTTIERTPSQNSQIRKSTSIATLPSPPPAIPLPPLPNIASSSSPAPPNTTDSPTSNGPTDPSQQQPPTSSRTTAPPPPPGYPTPEALTEAETRLRLSEKHLFAEKQLTATLEEALVDLEAQGQKTKLDCEGWRKKAMAMDEELREMKARGGREVRLSVQAVEEERGRREEAERARARLEERMRELNDLKGAGGGGKKGKKGGKGGGFNCF